MSETPTTPPDHAALISTARQALNTAREEADRLHFAWREQLKAVSEAEQQLRAAEADALASLGIQKEEADAS